jgi:hypothetical protein
MPLTAQLRDAFLGIQQRVHCCGTERTDCFRFDGHQLAEEKLPADLHLIGLRCAVVRWPALHDVADIHVRAADGNSLLGRGVFDHLRQQLAGTADERKTLLVFIGARSFADKHEWRLLIAGSEDNRIAPFAEPAAAAIADIEPDLIERVIVRRQTGQWGCGFGG